MGKNTNNMKEYNSTLLKYPSAWVNHNFFAAELVRQVQPDVVVDLGVDYAYSTFCFAFPNIGKVYGVDWFLGDEHAGNRNTYREVLDLQSIIKEEYGIDNVEFIQGDFTQVSLQWNQPIQILHIDGLHTYEAVSQDYMTWKKHLSKDGIVLFHDTLSYPETVGRFFNELKGYKWNKLDSHGLGILAQTEKSRDIIEKTFDTLLNNDEINTYHFIKK